MKLALALMLLLPLRLSAQDTIFRAMPIPDDVFERMSGRSFPSSCTTKRHELRYLLLSYCDAQGETRRGEMVCHRDVAADLVDIFRELWKAGYRIERMQLIDDFEADDQRSMEANNTSCFCFRTIRGGRTVSKHGLGRAVDINPLYNPYVYTRNGTKIVEPQSAKPWAYNRSARSDIPYKIDRTDLAYRLFKAKGWRWGGERTKRKDYQHFER